MEIRKSKRQIPIPFNDQRFKELAIELSDLNGELEVLKEQKKDSAAGFKRQIDSLQERIDQTAGLIHEGSEKRLVDVQIHLDTPEPGKKTIFHEDKEIAVEEMTASDKQKVLPLGLPDDPVENTLDFPGDEPENNDDDDAA